MEKTLKETLHFKKTLADGVIERLGIASMITAIDTHQHIRRIMAGSAGLMFLDEISDHLQKRRATISGKLVLGEHLGACLCSPMLTIIIREHLQHRFDLLNTAIEEGEEEDSNEDHDVESC